MKKITSTEIDTIISRYITRKHSRSGGHGGQHVNKKETKAEGYLHIHECTLFTIEQKNRLLEKYHNHISKQGVLRLTCQEQRKYHQNLETLKKHYKLLLQELGNEIIFDLLHHHRKHRR